ncbi:TATA element modulatory factor 1 TATA binding-domain-containing protein [Microdochium trichocladiopsis]|uniref:TATA element modulatory factor 1 TATA binding-domain-containing protein n=1 Tax=Microdochium trichocladiopsis TaxID=1682393 RepID=A0A9P8Y887_9PEZI|nr:TATA element modulatory factor 1 TATA binding-domain-containing protein [Microdochium trichocladiopsis]KAH7030801.1 TATA element modulatory factor 1 TATA binding-domain-containing protein [Microdochium trichocladiopsis]
MAARWGSFLSQAVAGVEARLDTILAEDDPKSTPASKPAIASATATSSATTTTTTTTPPPRSSTPSRSTNDRLQERLARAMAAKGSSQSTAPRSSTEVASSNPSPRPSLDQSARPSTDSPARLSTDTPRISLSADDDASAKATVPLDTPVVDRSATASPATQERGSTGAQQRSASPAETQYKPEATMMIPGLAGKPLARTPSTRVEELEKALEELRAQHQEEILGHTERVDALQSKLQYLAREALDSAKATSADAPAGSLEKKLADKDQQVALLMEEGQKLSSTEQKLRAMIKKLRAQLAANEKDLSSQKVARQKAESEWSSAKRRLKDAEDSGKSNEDAHKLVAQLKRDVDRLKSEVATKSTTITDLKARIQEETERYKTMAAKANDQLVESKEKRIRELEDAVAALEVEKGLVADRAKAQASELREKADRAAERSRAVELELKGEVQILESKLEALRARAEEASSGAVGDAQAKLLRQIETLQTQYSIASENWQGMEASLAARVASLEKERDEALRRESDMRKKAREAAARAKIQEEELEEAKTQLPQVKQDLSSHQSQLEALRARAEAAEAALAESKADLEKQKRSWKAERSERAESSDRRGWLDEAMVASASVRNGGSRPESPLLSAPQRTFSSDFLGLQNFPTKLRKTSAPSSNGEPPSLAGERQSPARRPSALAMSRPSVFSSHSGHSAHSPSLFGGLEPVPSLPSHPEDRDEMFDNVETPLSPQNVLHDMVSVSTIGAGPSVQLVEKLSAAVRRLESEKVAAKEELARISGQRDEARNEIVALMKEAELGKAARQKTETLEKEVAEINERYQTTLEMLGEKSELVEELKADVQDVKAMYRDLVERTIK